MSGASTVTEINPALFDNYGDDPLAARELEHAGHRGLIFQDVMVLE